MPISALDAHSKDFLQKTCYDLSKPSKFCLDTKEFARNPDTFSQPIPKLQIPNRRFL